MSITPEHRLTFLDNLRCMTVLAVVLLHAACPYSNMIVWWSVREPAKGPLFDILITILVIFVMPTLFFISGYFALPSLRRRTWASFVLAKLKRLGLPLLVVGILFVPIIPYVRVIQTPGHPGFLDFWLQQMATLFRYPLVDYSIQETALAHMGDYSPWHLWYLSLLLVFMLVLVATNAVWKILIKTEESNENQGKESRIVACMGIATLCAALSSGAVNMIYGEMAWLQIESLILIQVIMVPFYLVMFTLGLAANHRQWFADDNFPGSTWKWLCATIVLILLFMGTMDPTENFMLPREPAHALMVAALHALASMSFLGLLLSFYIKRRNHANRLDSSLAKSSYDIYILHLPIILPLQYLFMSIPFPPLAKVVLIFCLTTILCWTISRFVLHGNLLRKVVATALAFILLVTLV